MPHVDASRQRRADKRTGGTSQSMSEQPAIARGLRRWWLIAGGVLAAIALAFFIAADALDRTLALIGIVTAAGLYLAILVCAFAIRTPRARGVTLAALTIALAASALGLLLALFVQQSSAST